eukprot:gene12090-15197_t
MVSAAASQQSSIRQPDYLNVQVQVLMDAFTTLANAVVEELGEQQKESVKWRRDREEWLGNISEVLRTANNKLLHLENSGVGAEAVLGIDHLTMLGQENVRRTANDKLLHLEKSQAMMQLELHAAKTEMETSVNHQLEKVVMKAAIVDRDVMDAKCEVQMMRNQVDDLLVLTSADFPTAVLNQRLTDKKAMQGAIMQRLTDKKAMQGAIMQVVHELAPSAGMDAVRKEAPHAVHEQVHLVVHELAPSAGMDAVRKEAPHAVHEQVHLVVHELAPSAGMDAVRKEAPHAVHEQVHLVVHELAPSAGMDAVRKEAPHALHEQVHLVVHELAPSAVTGVVWKEAPKAVSEQILWQLVLIKFVVHELAPSAVTDAVRKEAPHAVREQVHLMMSKVEGLSREVESLSLELNQLSGEVLAVQARCQMLEGSLSGSMTRLSSLESLEESYPSEFIGQLQDKVEKIAGQHSKGQKLALDAQRIHLNETREAVLRCANVFSQVLNIPPPIPTGVLGQLSTPIVSPASSPGDRRGSPPGRDSSWGRGY